MPTASEGRQAVCATSEQAEARLDVFFSNTPIDDGRVWGVRDDERRRHPGIQSRRIADVVERIVRLSPVSHSDLVAPLPTSLAGQRQGAVFWMHGTDADDKLVGVVDRDEGIELPVRQCRFSVRRHARGISSARLAECSCIEAL